MINEINKINFSLELYYIKYDVKLIEGEEGFFFFLI